MTPVLLVAVVVLAALVVSARTAIGQLRDEVGALRKEVDRLRDSVPGMPPGAPVSSNEAEDLARPPALPADLAAPAPPARPASVRRARPAGWSLESFVGGRVLLVAGVVVVLCGLAFFLKYAFDRDWIRPPMRIALGVLVGLAALVGGDKLRGRGWRAFGHALMGCGLGSLYLSNYFAAVRYGFIERPAAFTLAGAITALGAAVAVWRDARLLAHLGLLGGFLAPALLGRDVDALEPVACWLIVLDVGVLVVLWRRAWPGLELMALAASCAYFASWRLRFLVPDRVAVASLVVAALVLALQIVSILPALLARRPVLTTSLVTAGVAGLLGFLAAHDLLDPTHREVLGASVVALGMLWFLGARLLALRVPDDETGRQALDVLGLAALATSVPLLLRGHAVAPAWGFGGVAAVALWRTRRLAGFDVIGIAMVVLAVGNLLGLHWPVHSRPFTPFVNGAFLSFASPALAFCACGVLLLRDRDTERARLGGALVVAGIWLLVPLLAIECVQHFTLDRARYGPRSSEYAQAAAGIVLAGYALVVAGLSRRSSERSRSSALVCGPLAGALVLGVVLALAGHRVPFTPGINLVLLAGLTVVVASLAVSALSQGTMRRVALHGGLICGLFLLWGEFHAFAELAPTQGSRAELRFWAQLWISVAWALYAAALVAVGFRRREVDLRWAGLGVFAVTLGKVFVVDMAGLSTAYRIGSFLVLGVLLLAASFLYQRRRAAA